MDSNNKVISNNFFVKENIEKANMDMFNNLKFKKFGVVIKDKLKIQKDKEKIEKDNIFSDLLKLRTQIPLEPKEEISNWELRGLNLDKTNLPKLYSYNIIYPANLNSNFESISNRSAILIPEKNIEASDREKMESYNQKVHLYIASLIELIYIDTLLENICDHEEYELNKEQLASLDF